MTDTTVHTPAGVEPPLEPAATPAGRPINSAHVVASSGTVAALAGLLQWASTWPLKPLDAATASDIAGLIVMCGAGVIAFLKSRFPASKT